MKTAIQLFRIRKRNLLLLKKIFDVKRLTKISYWSGIISVKENFPKLQKHYQFTERQVKKLIRVKVRLASPLCTEGFEVFSAAGSRPIFECLDLEDVSIFQSIELHNHQ